MDKPHRLIDTLSKETHLPSADKWDKAKFVTEKVIRNYAYSYVNWRTASIRQLEKKRNRILRGKLPLAARIQLTEPIDQVLEKLQQKLATIEGSKMEVKWREQGEKYAGFLNVYINNIRHNSKWQQSSTWIITSP